jgi:hypothetical protein
VWRSCLRRYPNTRANIIAEPGDLRGGSQAIFPLCSKANRPEQPPFSTLPETTDKTALPRPREALDKVHRVRNAPVTDRLTRPDVAFGASNAPNATLGRL